MPASTPQPSVMNYVARQKHNAWAGLRGTSKDRAKQLYVDELAAADARYVRPVPAESAPAAKAAVQQQKRQLALKPGETAHDVPVLEAVARPGVPGTAVSVVPAGVRRAREAPAQQRDVMLAWALKGSLALVGMGVAGFLFTTLSYKALFFLALAGAGVSGVAGALLVALEEHGLIIFLPSTLRRMLLDSTWLEFLVDDALFREFKVLAVQVLPMMLAHENEDKRMEALALMTPATRRWLTARGMIRSMPTAVQRLLLPRALREQMERDAPQYRLQKAPLRDPATFARLMEEPDPFTRSRGVEPINKVAEADAGDVKGEVRVDLAPSQRLLHEIFARIVSKKNVEFTLANIDPYHMRTVCAVLGSFTLVQVTLMQESRQIFFSLVRTALLVSTLLGSVGCGGLCFVWLAAMKKKRAEGW